MVMSYYSLVISLCTAFYNEIITRFPHFFLGPNKNGLVTYIQVNVYIGITLSCGSTVDELSKLTSVED